MSFDFKGVYGFVHTASCSDCQGKEDANNMKKSVNLIKQEMKNMEKGLIDDEEIKAAIITYKNTL